MKSFLLNTFSNIHTKTRPTLLNYITVTELIKCTITLKLQSTITFPEGNHNTSSLTLGSDGFTQPSCLPVLFDEVDEPVG